MIIVIDGAKGSGKTEFCKRLEREFTAKGLLVDLFKSTRGEDPFSEMNDAISVFKMHPHTIHICDRFAITEFLFSVYYARLPLEDLTRRIRGICERLQPPEALHYVFLARPEVIAARLANRVGRTENDLPLQAVEPLWKLASTIALPHVKIHYNDGPEDAQRLSEEIFRTPRVESLVYLAKVGWI